MSARRIKSIVLSVLGAAIVGYFLYHTVEGDRGWFAMLRLQGQVDTARANLTQLQDEHQKLERRTQKLRAGSLDADLLDEQARKSLNYSKQNDLVILTPTADQPPASAR